MDPKTTTKIVTIVLLVLALVTTVASTDGSQFHCDPGRTGNASGDAPLTDTLLWATNPTGDGFICAGASIFIGDVKDPVFTSKAHIQHPDTSERFYDTTTYLDWYANKPGYQYNPDNLTIGVASWYESSGSAEIPKLIHTLEEKGANVIPIGFTDTGDMKRFYIVNNEVVVDVVVCTKSFRINMGDADQGIRDLETLDVPVMRALRLYYMAPAAWHNETSHGISIMDLGFQVGLPEMDGIIDPIVIAGKNASDSEYQPIDTQINWTADRASAGRI